MLKLVMHVVVATVLWLGTGALGLHVALRIGAVMLGGVAVHFVWERLIFKPYAYLGARPVPSDDPVMIEAVNQAKASWDQFVAIYPEHREDSMVKFRFKTDRGTTENLWGDLISLSSTEAEVYVRTPPVEHEGQMERTVKVPIDDIVDWQVEFRDGTLAGGFSNRAMFKIFEREEGYMHPEFKDHIGRFRDLQEPPAN